MPTDMITEPRVKITPEMAARYLQRISDEVWAHALTKTWNKWRSNEPMKLLKVSVSGVGSSRTPLPDLV